MTYDELKNHVSEYLAARLHAGEWAKATQQKRDAATLAAHDEVFLRLPGLSLADFRDDAGRLVAAVGEQAVWLLAGRQPESAKEVQSESIDGVSTTYAASRSSLEADPLLAPKAVPYIRAIRREKCLAVRFTRG